jgi:hypothetical protein
MKGEGITYGRKLVLFPTTTDWHAPDLLNKHPFCSNFLYISARVTMNFVLLLENYPVTTSASYSPMVRVRTTDDLQPKQEPAQHMAAKTIADFPYLSPTRKMISQCGQANEQSSTQQG